MRCVAARGMRGLGRLALGLGCRRRFVLVVSPAWDGNRQKEQGECEQSRQIMCMALLQFHAASCEPVVNGAMIKREHLLPGNVTKFHPKSGLPYYAPGMIHPRRSQIYEPLLISSSLYSGQTCALQRGIDFCFGLI
jgi:hypothetical protein